MELIHENRLRSLNGPWCSTAFLADLLGIDLEEDPKLLATFRTWSERFLGDSSVERPSSAGTQINRHALETYLLHSELISWKWAGVSLGVTEDLLHQVVDRLAVSSGLDVASSVSEQLVRQRVIRQLYTEFPRIRHRSYSNHSQRCRALHQEIRTELKLDVQPLLCVTSRVLDSAEPDVASVFDSVTLEPVALRYQVWLDTNKPVSLRPDACSLKFYAQHEQELRERIMLGSEPTRIDERLRAA